MADVYVVGIDMIRFGRYPERTVVQLAADAVLLALDDCGLGIMDIQALFSGNIGETMTGQRTLQLIGQTGIPVVNCTNACATARRRSGRAGPRSRRVCSTLFYVSGLRRWHRG